jgi:hypothetical protein
LAEAKARIDELEVAGARLAQHRGGVVMSEALQRAIRKSLHPDLTTNENEKARRTVFLQEFNALPIAVIAEKTKAREEARQAKEAQEAAQRFAEGRAKFEARSRRAKAAWERRKAGDGH